MSVEELELADIFSFPEWGKLLKSLSEAFSVAITMTDLKYAPLVEASGNCGFCRTILEHPEGHRRCMKCAALGGLEAKRTNRPFISHCHAGVTFGCVPVTVQSRYMGIICFGQVRVKGESPAQRSSVINGVKSRLDDGEDDALKLRLSRLFKQMPEIEEDRMVKIGNVLWNLTNYMVDRIVALKTENRSYEWVFQNALTPLIEEQSMMPEPAPKTKVSYRFPINEDHQLYPVLVYIEEHPELAVTMHEMADLCKLSHSYFSKIFTREIGMNFTDYVVGRKIDKARELLREGAESVADIASGLGFTDTSYFIKVFKKIEGTTPLAYRQLKYLPK